MDVEEDECPQLVEISAKKIPVTIITGFLGTYSILRHILLHKGEVSPQALARPHFSTTY